MSTSSNDEVAVAHYIPAKFGDDMLQLEFLGHDSIEQYDREAGYFGAALEYADRFHVHRETMGRFDQAFSPIVERLTGILRETDVRLTAKRKSQSPNPDRISPIRERFLSYMTRVWAKATEEQKTLLQAEALRVSRNLRISVQPASALSPVEPMFYKRADSILEADLETIDSKVSRWVALVPDYELARDADGKPLRESLARLLQRYESARFAMED